MTSTIIINNSDKDVHEPIGESGDGMKEFLQQIGYSQYYNAFIKAGYNIDSLGHITNINHLSFVGGKVSDRMKILKCIQQANITPTSNINPQVTQHKNTNISKTSKWKEMVETGTCPYNNCNQTYTWQEGQPCLVDQVTDHLSAVHNVVLSDNMNDKIMEQQLGYNDTEVTEPEEDIHQGTVPEWQGQNICQEIYVARCIPLCQGCGEYWVCCSGQCLNISSNNDLTVSGFGAFFGSWFFHTLSSIKSGGACDYLCLPVSILVDVIGIILSVLLFCPFGCCMYIIIIMTRKENPGICCCGVCLLRSRCINPRFWKWQDAECGQYVV